MNFSAPIGSVRNTATFCKQPKIDGKSQSSREKVTPEYQTQTTNAEINGTSIDGKSQSSREKLTPEHQTQTTNAEINGTSIDGKSQSSREKVTSEHQTQTTNVEITGTSNEKKSEGKHSANLTTSSLLTNSNNPAISSKSLHPSRTQATQESISDTNQSEKIDQRLKDDKIHDLDVLHKMYLCIVEYKAGQMNEREVILRISELSAGEDGLSFNDKADKNTYAIRNRYGHIKRNKDGNKKVMYDQSGSESVRINFSDLFKIQIIYKCCHILPPDIATQINILESKLLCILHKEINESHELPKEKLPKLPINCVTNGSTADLDKISLFVTENYYNKLAISKIEEEVNVLRGFTIDDNLSIYYIARKIVIIGELCHEIDERFNNPSVPSCAHSYSSNLFKIFKYSNKLRNLFIHKDLHRTLIFYKENNQDEFEKISQMLQDFFEGFYTILKNELPDNKVSQDHFLECITGENNLYTKLNILSADSLQNILDDYVIQAKTIVDIVNSDEYKLILECLRKDVLRSSDKEVNNLLLKIIEGMSNDESVNINDEFSRLNDLCILLNNAKDPEINKIVSTINACVSQIKEKFLIWPDDVTAQYFKSSFKAISASYKKLINGMNDFYKSVFAIYDVDLSMSTPDELNALANSVKTDPNIFNKFNILLKKINEEVALIRNIEYSDSIEEEKKSAIIEFAVAVIGQYLNALAHTKTSSVDNFHSSHILQDAKKTAVKERSNGLAHEVLNFNKEKFAAGLNDNVLPAYRSFKALKTINTFSLSTHKGIEVALSLANSFLKLKLYAQAAEHYKKCLEYVDNSESFFEITEDAAIEIDVDKIKSGIDFLELSAIRQLTMCYVLNNEPEKAIACSEKMLEKIVNMNAMAEAFENFINTLNIRDGNAFDYLINKIMNDGGKELSIYMNRDSYAKRVISIFFDVVNLLRKNKNYQVFYASESPDLRPNIAYVVEHIANAYTDLKELHKALELYNYALLFADEDHKEALLFNINGVSIALQNYTGQLNAGSDDARLKAKLNQGIWLLIGKNKTNQNEKQIVAKNTTALNVFNSNKRSLKESLGEDTNDVELLCHTNAVNDIDKKQDAGTIVQQLVDIENNTNKINASNDQKAFFYLKICEFLNDIADNVKLNKLDEVFILLNKEEYYLARAYDLLDPVKPGDNFEFRLERLIHSYCKDEVFTFDKLNTIAIKLLNLINKYNANNNLIWFYLSRKYMSIASKYFSEKDYNQASKYCNLALTCIGKISSQDLVFTNLKGRRNVISDGMKHTYFYIDYACHSQLGIISYENSMSVNASVHFKQAMQSINKALELDPQNAVYQKEKKECIALQTSISQQQMKQPIRRNQKK
jgi:hypothetical protein